MRGAAFQKAITAKGIDMLTTLYRFTLAQFGRLPLALIVLLTLLTGLVPALAFAQGSPASPAQRADASGGIAVQGEGEATSSPDVALVSLGVQSEGSTAREALDKNSAAMAAVIEAIKRSGIPENSLRTSGLTLTPVRARPAPSDQGTPPITGYQASNTLSVTVDPVTKAGEVIDVAVASGANVAGGVRFAIKDDAELRRAALDQAGRSARGKAEALAGALGLRVTGVQSVSEETFGGGPVARAELAQSSGAAVAVAPPVQPGELTLRVRVHVVFNFA